MHGVKKLTAVRLNVLLMKNSPIQIAHSDISTKGTYPVRVLYNAFKWKPI